MFEKVSLKHYKCRNFLKLVVDEAGMSFCHVIITLHVVVAFTCQLFQQIL
jgi:hypothetical protein